MIAASEREDSILGVQCQENANHTVDQRSVPPQAYTALQQSTLTLAMYVLLGLGQRATLVSQIYGFTSMYVTFIQTGMLPAKN